MMSLLIARYWWCSEALCCVRRLCTQSYSVFLLSFVYSCRGRYISRLYDTYDIIALYNNRRLDFICVQSTQKLFCVFLYTGASAVTSTSWFGITRGGIYCQLTASSDWHVSSVILWRHTNLLPPPKWDTVVGCCFYVGPNCALPILGMQMAS